MRTFGFLKVPVIAFLSPTIEELDDNRCVVKIPLTYRSKNHLKCMYFGALAAGADIAGGFMAMRFLNQGDKKVNIIFKDFHADFLKRAEADTFFTCEDGPAVKAAVDRALETGERQSIPVHVVATTPSKLGSEPVAKFTLTLSMKKQQVKP
ncbi:MAG: PaaI family thioesterase [Bdellovibrionota bacterium]